MSAIKNKYATLKNGKHMPLLGLGCWQSKPGEVEKAVETALDCGYRHIDTAYNYQNEAEVGIGIQNWLQKDPKNKREDLFVVTKLPGIGMTPQGVRKYLLMSLKSLKLDYADLYLVHSPIGFIGKNDKDVFPVGADGKMVTDEATDLIAIWKEMEKMVTEGNAKSIGVSNFSIKQLRKIEAISTVPCVTNQVEMHVSYQRRELADFCKHRDIVLTAYAPLGSPGKSSFSSMRQPPNHLTNPIVTLVAQNHKVTTAQVLIRYLIQEGAVVIPKSVTPERIKSNGDVFSFELSNTEMDALRLLDKGKDGRTFVMVKLPGLVDHPEAQFV